MDFLSKVYAWVKAHWATVMTVGTILWGVYGTTLKDYVSHHPALAQIWAGIYALALYYLTSPKDKPTLKKAQEDEQDGKDGQ